MFNTPKTIEEARKIKYNSWAGNPNGNKYDERYCAYEVSGGGRMMLFYQCSRLNGHGPDGLYCKQHAKMIEDRQ